MNNYMAGSINGYIREEWQRDDLLEFLSTIGWRGLAAAIEATTNDGDSVVIYRKGDMFYLPEQVK